MKDFLYKLATDRYRGPFFAISKLLLLLLSFVYGAVIRGLTLLLTSRAVSPKCRVISIGNITLGGTGKTSLVKFVALTLQANKHKVAIISRGYKRLALGLGDEPSMLLNGLKDIPVIVDRDRLRGAQRAADEYAADTVIFDDGMQQWRVKKDLEIVVVNAVEAFGNRHMIPRGVLREPLSSLKRADVFVLAKTNLVLSTEDIKKNLNKIKPGTLIVETIHHPEDLYELRNPQKHLATDFLKDKNVALFSGIGDPDSFVSLVRNLGAKPKLDLRFIDHHNYSDEDISGIINKSKQKDLKIIVTTEKDASRLSEERLKPFDDFKLLVLPIKLKIVKNEGEFIARLLSLRSI
ncbi:MAG: tetraacyldisaccharide 4'-kinase [Candidatus Omnitrophica bacterium]|nr:tetraacyldisaccharide 4'-kinase [Candidatus Omnitrophota bacterium]